MAELKLHVNVDKGQLDVLKKEIDSIKSKKIKIEVDSTAIDKAVKEVEKFDKSSKDTIKTLTDYNNSVNNVKIAELELAKAKEQTLQSQNKTKQAVEKSSQEYDKYRRSINEVTKEELKLRQEQEKTTRELNKSSDEFDKVGNAAEQAGKKTQGFISTFVKSAVIYQAIYAIRQAFMDALDTMKEVDSQLVTVRKVTQATSAEISQIKDKAYATASKYGVGAADYLESVAQFARAGYKGQSDALAELSTKTQIVGDTTAEVANQFLLSMDAAYQYQGSVEKLTAVLDGANEIDNNYATSIEKIAEGLGLIAPIASQVHVSEQELTSAIGTITAVTQRSGSEAARALRALFLNIIGDTTTEIEDGVTATEESVGDLQKLLQHYAPEAVKAAQATGKIIDPMEAIAALSQSMKDGLLTEQELMEQLSSLGGKLRTSQLVALVSNFDMYQQMMGTYADSVGSADREVENALDSWERKTQILANTWTEFIEKSLSTDMFKGFLDGLTQLLGLFGNLGNMLITVGGAFVALKLPSIIKSFQDWKKTISEVKDGMGSMGGNLGKLQIGIAAVTAAFTAVTMAYNAYRQSVEEDIRNSIEDANAKADEAQNVYALYQAYEDAEAAYDGSKTSKEALTQATNDLAAALGIESENIQDVIGDLKNLTQAEIDEARSSAELALQKKVADLDPNQRDPIRAFTESWGSGLDALFSGDDFFSTYQRMMKYFPELQNIAGKSADQTAKIIVAAYDKALKKQKEIANETRDQSKRTAQQNEEWKAAQYILDMYAESVEDLRTQLNNLDMYDAMDAGTWETAKEGLEATAENAEKAAEEFGSLKKAVEDAQTAIDEFNEATKTEKDDQFKSFAGIYEDFLTDWEAGLKGSNKVQAAIKALFPEDVLDDLWAQGKDAGELLASEFYQGIFTYIDDEGKRQFTKGEDRGSLLAYALWDNDQITQLQEDGSKVIKLGDEVVASLTQNGEELSVSVDDFDKLAQALYEVSGVPLSGDFLASWMSALGMYNPELQITAQELMDLAEAAGALNGETINLQDFVQGQLDLGTAPEDIRDMVDKLLSLKDKGEIDLDIQADSVEDAKTKVNELIEKSENVPEVKLDTTKPVKNLDILGNKIDETDQKDVNIEMTSTGYEQLITQFHNISTTMASIPSHKTISLAVDTTGFFVPNGFASGTSSAPGGMTLVNEQGPEVIQEGPFARIAGGGMPTITWVDPGATIYTAGQTKSILGGIDPSIMFGGINAFAGGTATGITRWRSTKSTAAATAAGTSVGASAAKGSSRVNTQTLKTTATKATSDNDRLKQLKDIVSLRESELSLLQAQEAPIKDQINKNKQIQQALMDEINYLKSIGGSQEEINQLYTKWYKIQKDIADLQDQLYKQLQTAIKGQIDKLNEKREEEKKIIQDQIDAMKEARDTRDEQLELEEKILAVQKAEQALQNAMTERTVRYFNAITGQWEWAANASSVKSAAEQLETAQKALDEYQDNAAYNAAIAELEAQQDAIDAKYDDLEERWEKISESLEAPVMSIKEALDQLVINYVPSMATDVSNLNKLLAQFGYNIDTKRIYVGKNGGLPVYDNGGVLSGIGGIKAIGMDEMILPPDITERMLSVSGSSAMLGARLNELRYLYGVTGSLKGNVNNSIGSQYNGDLYKFGNITLSAAQAESMTVAELARASRNLRLYSANM